VGYLRLKFLDSPLVRDRGARHLFDTCRIEIPRGLEQHPRLAEPKLSLANQVQRTLRQLEQTRVIRDRLARRSNAFADLFLREVELAAQTRKGIRLLQAI